MFSMAIIITTNINDFVRLKSGILTKNKILRSYLADHYCFLSSNNVYSRSVDVVYDFIH